jgi:hypothetical protein
MAKRSAAHYFVLPCARKHGEQDGDKISLTTLNYAIDFGSRHCYITHILAH